MRILSAHSLKSSPLSSSFIAGMMTRRELALDIVFSKESSISIFKKGRTARISRLPRGSRPLILQEAEAVGITKHGEDRLCGVFDLKDRYVLLQR